MGRCNNVIIVIHSKIYFLFSDTLIDNRVICSRCLHIANQITAWSRFFRVCVLQPFHHVLVRLDSKFLENSSTPDRMTWDCLMVRSVIHDLCDWKSGIGCGPCDQLSHWPVWESLLSPWLTMTAVVSAWVSAGHYKTQAPAHPASHTLTLHTKQSRKIILGWILWRELNLSRLMAAQLRLTPLWRER